MKSTSSLDFGLFIAFFVPGFVAFYTISRFSPAAKSILDLSLTPDSGFSSELGIGLFSVGLGIVVSAIRDLILDRIQFIMGTPRPPLNRSKLKEADTLAAYEAAINNIYRYSQFYGNMFVASFVLVLLKVYDAFVTRTDILMTIIFVFALVCLFVAHRKELKLTYKTLGEILS